MLEITLAAARVNSDLTQTQVVKLLKEGFGIEITRQRLADFEKDATDVPISLAKALSKVYSIPEENIFFGDKSTLSYTLRVAKRVNFDKQPA